MWRVRSSPDLLLHAFLVNSSLSLCGKGILSFWASFPFFSRILGFVWEENPVFCQCFSLHLAKINKQGREGLGHQSLPTVHGGFVLFCGCCRYKCLERSIRWTSLLDALFCLDLNLLLGGRKRGLCDSVPVPCVVPHQTPFLGCRGTKGFYLPRICWAAVRIFFVTFWFWGFLQW